MSKLLVLSAFLNVIDIPHTVRGDSIVISFRGWGNLYLTIESNKVVIRDYYAKEIGVSSNRDEIESTIRKHLSTQKMLAFMEV